MAELATERAERELLVAIETGGPTWAIEVGEAFEQLAAKFSADLIGLHAKLTQATKGLVAP